MSLIGLSSDALNVILWYLDGFAIIKLIECGCGMLGDKICRSDLELRIPAKPFTAFPFSPFKLPRLKSLVVSNVAEYAKAYPISLKGAIPLPIPTSTLSLTTLIYEFSQSFSILRLGSESPRLETLFPNLTTLELGCSSSLPSASMLKAIPRSLKHLRLEYATYYAEPSMTCSALCDLPPQLESLHIYGGLIKGTEQDLQPSSKGNDCSVIVWPSMLRRLYLGLIHPSILQNLPATVEDLKLWIVDQDGHNLSYPVPTEIFPNTLLKLSVTVYSLGRERLSFKSTTWPPNLKDACLDLNPSISHDCWSTIPASLTSISVSPRVLAQVVPLLPNLTLIAFADQYPPSLLSKLPAHLTHFSGSGTHLSEIPHLPMTLRTLSIGIKPASDLSSNPDSTSLLCEMMRLPPRLTALYMSNSSAESKFSALDFQYLPRSLQTLRVDLKYLEDADTLKALPSNLKTLLLTAGFNPEKPGGALMSDSELVDYLPVTLTRFDLTMTYQIVPWKAWMTKMRRFPRLVALNVSWHDSAIPSEGPVVLDFLASIPDSITKLTLPMLETKLKPEQMKCLPKSLTCLIFISSGGDNTGSDACFAHLPPSLAQLKLPEFIRGLTPKLFDLLPPNICILDIPSLDSPTKQYFSRNQEWQN